LTVLPSQNKLDLFFQERPTSQKLLPEQLNEGTFTSHNSYVALDKILKKITALSDGAQLLPYSKKKQLF
jgi:hypothetical protein